MSLWWRYRDDVLIFGSKAFRAYINSLITLILYILLLNSNTFFSERELDVLNLIWYMSRDGAVVRALVSHQCVPGLIPGPGVANFPFVNGRCHLKRSMPFLKRPSWEMASTVSNGNDRIRKGNLPRRHMWVEFDVGSLLRSERFFPGYSRFPLSSKANISKFTKFQF